MLLQPPARSLSWLIAFSEILIANLGLVQTTIPQGTGVAARIVPSRFPSRFLGALLQVLDWYVVQILYVNIITEIFLLKLYSLNADGAVMFPLHSFRTWSWRFLFAVDSSVRYKVDLSTLLRLLLLIGSMNVFLESKLQNIYPESATFKAKDLKLKVKKKRPRPKVWRPEKVKVAKRAKITKSTSNGKRRKYSIFGCMSLMVDGSDYESYF